MEQKEIVETTGVKIPPYAKIKVYWDDKPENYSKESRARVRKYLSSKYGIPTQNINVIYRPIRINGKGEVIEIEGATIDNIMNIPYQRSLFKEWLERNSKDVDYNRLIALDDKVNGELDIDIQETIHRRYHLSWLMVNNFLSYGEDNYFPINKFKGLTVVNSEPANQGGKTTLTIDAVKFLFFGKTTKTDTNVEVFNQYNDNKDLIVRGMMNIDGEDDFIIERHMTRKPKRKGGWNVTNKLSYYRILPDGEEEEMNDEDATKTTNLIKDTVGSEKDFDLMVLATSRNLDDLIDSSAGDSGKLLTRFIGLEVIASKEEVSRDMYNKFSKTMKSNLYDIETLKEEIEQHEKDLVELAKTDKDLNDKLETEKKLQTKYNNDKIELVASKEKIDADILTLNPSKIEGEIDEIKKKGVGFKKEVEAFEKQIKEIGTINFDEDKHFKLTNEKTQLDKDIAVKKAEIVRLQKVVEDLIAGGICQSCNRKLDDVDNTEHINEHNKTIDNITRELNTIERKHAKVVKELEDMASDKAKIDSKNALENKKDRVEIEMESLRSDLKSKQSDLKKYKQNVDAIDGNKKIDADISLIDTKIAVCENQKEEISGKIQTTAIEINNNTKDIELKNGLIKTIKKEKEIEKIFKVYIEMVGKKGISKLVLRSVLPIINSELQRLLEDITNFDVEVFIDDKNEVRYLLVKDGVDKPLKSGSGFEKTAASIALRCVLGKMSSLPKPNFIAFDEVLGRVAPENIPNMRPLFERISDMFDIVFFITQITEVKDWGDNIITIHKEKNISKIKAK